MVTVRVRAFVPIMTKSEILSMFEQMNAKRIPMPVTDITYGPEFVRMSGFENSVHRTLSYTYKENTDTILLRIEEDGREREIDATEEALIYFFSPAVEQVRVTHNLIPDPYCQPIYKGRRRLDFTL